MPPAAPPTGWRASSATSSGHKLGVPVVVENKTGAGGRFAAQQVKATPAGQNVLMLANRR